MLFQHRKQDSYMTPLHTKGKSEATNTKKNMCHLYISRPLNRKVTNIFKHTALSIAYRATNTLFNRLKNTKET
jgi:hypothetical protein